MVFYNSLLVLGQLPLVLVVLVEIVVLIILVLLKDIPVEIQL